MNAFTVMPMSKQILLTPGETYTGEISIVNPVDSTHDFQYKLDVTPYNVIGDDYTADLATVSKHNEIVKWIKLDSKTGTVAPNETKKVTYTIEVPKDASAGGQYATITVQDASSSASTGSVAVNNIFEMASIIYGNVSGDIVHEGEVVENNIPGFVLIAPIELTSRIENRGNVHENATYQITVDNFLTGEKIYPTNDKEGEFNEVIMPETSRLVEREVGNLPALGVVKVNQTIYYQGEIYPNEQTIIICPIWFLLLVVLTIGAIIAFIVSRIKKHNRKKAHIA